MLPEKISFRPGSLAGPMGRKLKATGETPSAYLRRLIAADCGKPEPAMPEGNPQFRKQKKLRTKAKRKGKR
jgi:hypothetical protein